MASWRARAGARSRRSAPGRAPRSARSAPRTAGTRRSGRCRGRPAPGPRGPRRRRRSTSLRPAATSSARSSSGRCRYAVVKPSRGSWRPVCERRADERLGRLVEPGMGAEVQQPRVAADRGGGDDGAGPGDAHRLAQREHPILRLDEVIERPEQEHDVEAGVRRGQRSRVADARVHALDRRRPLDVLGHQVDERHVVPVASQPAGVDPGPPPTSSTRAGGAGRTRPSNSTVRTNSRRPCGLRVSRTSSTYSSA